MHSSSPEAVAVRPARWRAWLVGAVVLVVAVVGYFYFTDGSASKAAFVADTTCFECHAEQHRAWTGSHHDLAMDHATPQTVLGDFDDAAFTHNGITSRFYRRDAKYFVETDGPDGKLAEFEIKFVFGVTPLQQYLIELDGGRLQCLQVSWDTDKKRWYHIFDEPTPHDDVLHWTGMQFNWNFMCAECHSTNLQRNYDDETNAYATTWSDIDVGCQACHGPGSKHNEWAYAGGKGVEGDIGLTVRLKDAKPQVDHCARCHARRVLVSEQYEYGDDFLDHYAPRLLTEPLYHTDGQILDEVYVYGSLLQTKKYHEGVRCTDCHDPHTARLKRPGDATCTHCHQEDPPKKFPTVPRVKYDTPEHHFHPDGKEGAACVDCHMAARTYMGVDPRRDHSFRVPRPDLTEKIGTPNACNGCHKDKTPAWAVEEIEKRHPDYAEKHTDKLHFGQTFAMARAGRAEAVPALIALLQDRHRPAIVRATAAHHLGVSRRAEAIQSLGAALEDEHALVRGTAAVGLSELIHSMGSNDPLRRQKPAWLAPLLSDPTRWVRTEAARALVDVAADIPRDHRAAFTSAINEWLTRQRSQSDRPASHLNLGTYHDARGEGAEAEAAYLRAVKLDPGFAPVRFNLAMFYNRRGRNAEAVTQLQAVIDRNEDDGEAWYSLGLLHAELGRTEKAVTALGRAARLLPRNPRAARNYALALQQAERFDEAHAAFANASRIAPRDGELLFAWGLLSIKRRDHELVRKTASLLRALGTNGERAAEELLRRLEAGRDK